MHKLIKSTIIAMAVPTFAVTFPVTASAEEEPPCELNESRSGLTGCYHSQISAAEAFRDTVAKRGKWGDPSLGAIILDVRSTPEYRAGHPEHSYNVPYPFIYQYCQDVDGDDRRPDGACKKGDDDNNPRITQDPVKFVEYVKSIVPDKDTPIYTMCRTGVRSVAAANILTEAGYTTVRNMWEGFVGIYLQAPFQVPSAPDNPRGVGDLDVNHDGVFTDEDKNGWRYYQGLPYETRLLPHLMYSGESADTYYWD